MPSNVVRIVAWLATTALAIVMLAAGAPKLTGNADLKEPFIEFGWPDPVFFLTGLAEVLGAIGLLVKQIRVLAACLLGAIMIGAALTNLVNGDIAFVPFNIVLLMVCGALAQYYAANDGKTVAEAIKSTGQWRPS